MAEYIVITAQCIGSPDTGYRIAHYWDGERFSDRKSAISHGFEIRESDDFNIGVVIGGELASLDWMDREVIDVDRVELAAIAQEIGLGP